MPPQRKYICAFCARAFSRSEHKQRHERSHTNEKPFHCNNCTASFVRRDLLQRHCRTVHHINTTGKPNGVNISPTSSNGVSSESSLGEEANPPSQDETTAGHVIGDLAPDGSNSHSHNNTDPTRLDLAVGSTNGDVSPLSSVAASANMSSVSSGTFHSGTAKYKKEDYNLIDYSNLSEKNFISLLSLSKKFPQLNELSVNLRLNGKVSHYILIWGTISNTNLPIFQDFDELFTNQLNSNKDLENCLLYSILALGAIDSNQVDDCIKLFNKAWSILIKFSNPFYILKPLTILSFITLNYDLSLNKNFISTELVLDYLNDISYIVFGAAETTNIEDFYWMVLRLLSGYSTSFNKPVPKIYKKFLTLKVPDYKENITLGQLLNNLTVSVIPGDNNVINETIILCLDNELQSLKLSKELINFNNKSFLHNAVIFANKSFNNTFIPVSNSMNIDFFLLFKKKILINCPIKFQDLLINYVFNPIEFYQWNLLHLSIKEFNLDNGIVMSDLVQEVLNNEELCNSYINFSSTLLKFFNNGNINNHQFSAIKVINNNLGLISLPLIFNSQFINSNSNSNLNSSGFFKNCIHNFKFNQFNLNQFNSLLLEWYLTLFKVILNLKVLNLAENYILQSIIYIFKEMGDSVYLPTVNGEKLINGDMINIDSDNSLNNESIFYLLTNLNKVFNNWFNWNNGNTYKYSKLSSNINTLLNELVNNQLNLAMNPIHRNSISSIKSDASSLSPVQKILPSAGLNYTFQNQSIANPINSATRDASKIFLPPILPPLNNSNFNSSFR